MKRMFGSPGPMELLIVTAVVWLIWINHPRRPRGPTIFADFAPLVRRAFPRRFTIRYLLLATTTVALFLGLCVALASRQ
jgi:hypothetical protein